MSVQTEVERMDSQEPMKTNPSEKQPGTSLFQGRSVSFYVICGVCILIAVIAVAGVVGFLLGRSGSSSKSSKKSEGEEKESVGLLYRHVEGLLKSKGIRPNSEVRPHADIQFAFPQIRTFCTDNGLTVMNLDTAYSFMAYNDTMRTIITVEKLNGKTFEDLVSELILSSAPLNSHGFIESDNYLVYEGYLDKDQPELGFCYLELICSDDGYIFIQGLGEKPSDPDIAQVRLMAYHLEELVGIR